MDMLLIANLDSSFQAPQPQRCVAWSHFRKAPFVTRSAVKLQELAGRFEQTHFYEDVRKKGSEVQRSELPV